MNEEDLKEQINSLIRDEIQDVINDFVEEEEESKKVVLDLSKPMKRKS